MFGSLGAPELLFILGLALLIFGPSKLPEMGRTMGKAMAEFRKAANDFKRTLNAEAIEREMREADPRRVVNDTLAKAKKDLDSVMHPDTKGSEVSGDAESAEETEEPVGASGTVARGMGATTDATDTKADEDAAQEGEDQESAGQDAATDAARGVS